MNDLVDHRSTMVAECSAHKYYVLTCQGSNPGPRGSRNQHTTTWAVLLTSQTNNCSFLAGVGRSLGTIDPRLYKLATDDVDDDYDVPDNHLGRIWFSVKYESHAEKLLVTLVKAKNLSTSTRSGGTGLTGGTSGAVGDHYVRFVASRSACRLYPQSIDQRKARNATSCCQVQCQDCNRVTEARSSNVTREGDSNSIMYLSMQKKFVKILCAIVRLFY